MAEDTSSEKPIAQQWFEEQQAWQKMMRDYADSMAKDENFLMHLGNAMRGSLLAGTPYPQPAFGDDDQAAPQLHETLAEILFSLKRIDGRLRDIEAVLHDLPTQIPAPGESQES